MNKVSEILSYLTDVAPISWQESYDNCGLLVGDANAMVDKVLLTLGTASNVRPLSMSFAQVSLAQRRFRL